MRYYQRVRGHYLPLRAHWELPGHDVGAGSLRNILHSELSQLSSALLLSFSFSPPLRYDTLSHREMSAVSQEEKKKRRKAVVPLLLLLKISLVKFSPSQRLAAQTRGLQGVRGRRGKARKTERERKEGVGGWSRNTENEQIAQAKLAWGAQYVLERFANRSLFFIAKMKAAWASRECQTHLFICIVDYALCVSLSVCIYAKELRCSH